MSDQRKTMTILDGIKLIKCISTEVYTPPFVFHIVKIVIVCQLNINQNENNAFLKVIVFSSKT